MNAKKDPCALETEALRDLQQRLALLRARMAADGRDAAVQALDRAISREHCLQPTKREDT